MASQYVRDTDHGYRELARRWLGMRERGTVVGIFGEGAVKAHDDGVTNLLVAMVHEFGAPQAGIPARSWLRAWVDENLESIRRRAGELGAKVAKGELSQDAALEQFGLWIVGQIRKRIANKIPPPLTEATVRARLARRRSHDGPGDNFTPLIDSGDFWQAIASELRDR